MTSAGSAPSARPSEFPPPHPSSPLSGAVVDGTAVTFVWKGIPDATGYRLQVAPDRQFVRDLLEIETGVSTSVALHDTLPPSDAPRFWRVQAETPDGPTRWSPYGRFYSGSDAAVNAFRAEYEAEELEERKRATREQIEKEARFDLMPWVERDDTIPSRVEVGILGMAMILSFVLILLAIVMATLMAS